MEKKTPSRFEKLVNMTRADLAKDVLGIPVCPICDGAEWITDADKKTVPCECVERKRVAAVERENARAQIIVAFLDEIEATEFITADGCDRDVDPDGFGFSGQMLKLIEAIAEDEDDVWNTAARCALARPAPQTLRAAHWREAFDLAIGCIEFAATNKNDGPEFLVALRKYADLMIQELGPAGDTETKESTDGETGTAAEGRQQESES